VILADIGTAVYAPFGIRGFMHLHDDGTKGSRAVGRGIGMLEGGIFSLSVAGLVGLSAAAGPTCHGLCESAVGPATAGNAIAHLVVGSVLVTAGITSMEWGRGRWDDDWDRLEEARRSAAFVVPFAVPSPTSMVVGRRRPLVSGPAGADLREERHESPGIDDPPRVLAPPPQVGVNAPFPPSCGWSLPHKSG